MALTPKGIIGSVVGFGRGLLGRGGQPANASQTSGSPRTVGAPAAGEPGAPRSSTSRASSAAKGARKRS